MKKVKIYVLACVALLALSSRLNAQVTVGSQADPHKAAVLDLQSTDKGMKLTTVSLGNVAVFGLGTGLTAEEITAATGMMVYNTNPTVVGGKGEGVYFWDGTKWLKTGADLNTLTIPDYTNTVSNINIIGQTCFDVVMVNEGGTCGTLATRTNSFASTFSFVYTLVGTGYTNLTFQCDDASGLTVSPLASSDSTCILTFKSNVRDLASGTDHATAKIVILHAIFNAGGIQQKVSLPIKIQDCLCCEGFVCKDCAYDYLMSYTVGAVTPNNAGDWAKTGTPAYTTQSNPGITMPIPNLYGTKVAGPSSYFELSPAGDLCVYKKDAHPNLEMQHLTWVEGINICQSGAGAGNAGANLWYVPNIMEMYQVFIKLPNSGNAAKYGTVETFGGSADATPLTEHLMGSSTESGASGYYTFMFTEGKIGPDVKDPLHRATYRCVRRM